MIDKLTFKQLFEQIENLNASAFNAFLNEDFESFDNIIDTFINSDIMELNEFPIARNAYRFSSMPFTLNGFYIGTDDNSNFLEHVTERMYGTISDIKQRDIYPIYAFLTEQEKIERKENKLLDNRIEALDKFIALYKDLYKEPKQASVFGIPYVDSVEQHQKTYIDRIVELTTARSKFQLTFNFKCSLIDNELLANQNIPEKMNYLSKRFHNIFSDSNIKIEDYFSFSNDNHKILITNYMQGKGIDRKNWKNYKKGILSATPLFYLELAFYLSIPSSDEIEKFMNLHGFSIKSPMTHFHDIYFGKKIYHVLHKDLCRWIDAGIDYNLVNEMCGMKLETKEIKKKK